MSENISNVLTIIQSDNISDIYERNRLEVGPSNIVANQVSAFFVQLHKLSASAVLGKMTVFGSRPTLIGIFFGEVIEIRRIRRPWMINVTYICHRSVLLNDMSLCPLFLSDVEAVFVVV